MKRIIGVYRNQNMHWVGDGFPVKNLFSYDRLGQVISPFLGGVLKSMLLKSVNRKIENIETKFTIFSRFYNIEVVIKI